MIHCLAGYLHSKCPEKVGVGMSTLNKWIMAYRDTDVVSKEDLGLAQENDRLLREVRNPVVGTKLIRERDAVAHTVTVLKDGFDWQGRRYKSLSAVARAITGTRWNGYRFFGLRERKRGET